MTTHCSRFLFTTVLAAALLPCACAPLPTTQVPEAPPEPIDPATAQVWIPREEARGFDLDLDDVEVMIPRGAPSVRRN